MVIPLKEAKKNNETENEPIKKAEKEETTEAPSSQPVEYYLKHSINKKLIEGLVDNHRKKITRKEDIRGNFEIPGNIGGLKGIAEDVLVEVFEHVYPVDFVILDNKEDEKRPFILGTPFLTTAKAIEKGVKNDIEPIALIMTVKRLVLEWEERIKLHHEKEKKFNQWRSKNFKSKHLALVKVEGGMNDEGEVTSVVFSIGNDKAPVLDGYTSAFFKKSWDVVGDDVYRAIMACVTGMSFSINVNGNLHGYFKGKRGLRQGDPMSPYLFMLVMEILTLILKRKVHEDGELTYHNKCGKQKIVNICFADDLIMFARGDVHTARVLMEALDEFKGVLGLVSIIPKITIFMCNFLKRVKKYILQLMPFERGTLLVKYVGVLLISSRLLYKDCKILVERVRNAFMNGSVGLSSDRICFIIMCPSSTLLQTKCYPMTFTRILLMSTHHAQSKGDIRPCTRHGIHDRSHSRSIWDSTYSV
ncbi:putative reverse transcriptase domain, reverse transcriptase zinc-binding domain protein [Tanacetum coccineum]